MAQRDMTYQEYAEELANSYPDLDLQELSVDDIKTMMGHGFPSELSRYGLTPVSECPPSRRRSRQKSTRQSESDADMHHESTTSEHERSKDESAGNGDLEGSSVNLQGLESLAQFGGLAPFGDISKLPVATQQALYASAALLSFSRGQSGAPQVNPFETPPSLQQETQEDPGESSPAKASQLHAESDPNVPATSPSQAKQPLTHVSPHRQNKSSASSRKTTTKRSKAKRNVPAPFTRSDSSYEEHVHNISSVPKDSASAQRRNSEPALQPEHSSSGHTHNKLRQLLEVGYHELVGKWALETKEKQADKTSPIAAQTVDEVSPTREVEHGNMEQLKTMNPGHLAGAAEGLFKIPSEKNQPPPPPRGIELDTPPPSQTLPVNYGYAPNVVIRTDAATLPLTPPQASPPEISMADMTSMTLSNMMSKHLLSTTQGIKQMVGKFPLDTGVGITSSPEEENPSLSLAGASVAMVNIVNKPTTQISYLPLSSAGQNMAFSIGGSKIDANGAISVIPASVSGMVASPNAGVAGVINTSTNAPPMVPINGMFPNAPPIAAPTGQAKPSSSKKSKKRRRKSDSSDSISSSFGSPDGSPRLIKKIGRVIQTVENEQDLNLKVDAMLKNIMGKFQQRQGDTTTASPGQVDTQGQLQGQMRPPPPQESAHLSPEASIKRVAQQIGTMAAPPTVPPQVTKPSPKKKSKSKKKPPQPTTTITDNQQLPSQPVVGAAAAQLGVQLQEAGLTSTIQPTKSSLEQFMMQYHLNPAALSTAPAGMVTQTLPTGVVGSNPPQNLLQSVSTMGLGLPSGLIATTKPMGQVPNVSLSSQAMTPAISATQLMPTSEALAAAKKMLQDAGITLPDMPKPSLDGLTFSSANQSAPMLSSAPAQLKTAAGVSMPAVAGISLPMATQLNTQVNQAVHTQPTNVTNKPSSTVTQNHDIPFVTSPPGGHLVASPDISHTGNIQMDIKNPKSKKKKKKSVEKLSETDIQNIAQLLKMANSQYFAEFFNQLQAFAAGKNPDWMRQYPNIASYMGLKSDSKEKAKQILEYMREQTGVPEGEKMTSLTKLKYDQSVSASAKPAMLSATVSSAPVISGSKLPYTLSSPPAGDAGSNVSTSRDQASKYSHMNGEDGHPNQEASFIDSFQNFLHNKVPTQPATLSSTKPTKKSSRSAKSPAQKVARGSLVTQLPSPPLPVSSSSAADPSSFAHKAAPLRDPSTLKSPPICLDNTIKSLLGGSSADMIKAHSSVLAGQHLDSSRELFDGGSLVERLRRNYSDPIEEVPKCDCLKGVSYDETREGPYYTHLGAAPDVQAIRQTMEHRLGLAGEALRIERVLHTSKSGKTPQGCAIPRWILRRAGPEEKVLCVVRPREGHVCENAVLVISIVVWEGLPTPQADGLYTYLSTVLPALAALGSGGRAGTESGGLHGGAHGGATYRFGCSFSAHSRTCRFAKSAASAQLSKFKVDNVAEERVVEEKMQGLATQLGMMCKTAAPRAFHNMCQDENDAVECRLGNLSGRPFSGVTAVIDSSSHCQKVRTHSNSACSVTVTLKAQHEDSGPDDETLHIYPMCVLDTADEYSDAEAQFLKLRTGAIEYLTKHPLKPQQHGLTKRVLKHKRTLRQVIKRKVVPIDLITRLNLKSVTHRAKVTQPRGSIRSVLNSAFSFQSRVTKVSSRNLGSRFNVFKSQNSAQSFNKPSLNRKSKSTKSRGKKGTKTKRWQEMMSDPAFVNNLMTVGQQMYGSEAENMVGRLKTVAEQDRNQEETRVKRFKSVSVGGKNSKLCSQSTGKFRDNNATWEAWYRQNIIENGASKSQISQSTSRLKRSVSTPQNTQPMCQPTASKRPRSCTPTASGKMAGHAEDSSKPEEVAGWGMYAMPPNRSVFDIDSPRKSISTELLRSVNRHGSQTGVHSMLSPGSSLKAGGDSAQVDGQAPADANHMDAKGVNSPVAGCSQSTVSTVHVGTLKHEHVHSTNSQPKHTTPQASQYQLHQKRKSKRTRGKTVQNRKAKTSTRKEAAADMGGVAIALPHGSVLFEVSKRETHASIVRNKKSTASNISLVFHQQRGLNLPKHGREEYSQLEELRRLHGDIKIEELENAIKQEDDVKPKDVTSYKDMWDTSVVSAHTSTVNSVSYSWLKPQTAVSGPYQRWL